MHMFIHPDFLDSSNDFAQRLAEANAAEAKRLEPWAWAAALAILSVPVLVWLL
jgi:hypothetical protein